MQKLLAISYFRHSCSHLHLTILLLVSSLGACRSAIRVLNSFLNIFQKVGTYHYGSIKTCCYNKKYLMQELQATSCFRHSCSHLHLTITLLVSSLGACKRAILVLNSFSNIFQKVSTNHYRSIKTYFAKKCSRQFHVLDILAHISISPYCYW